MEEHRPQVLISRNESGYIVAGTEGLDNVGTKCLDDGASFVGSIDDYDGIELPAPEGMVRSYDISECAEVALFDRPADADGAVSDVYANGVHSQSDSVPDASPTQRHPGRTDQSFDDLWCQQRQPQQAANLGDVHPLGLGDLGHGPRPALVQHPLPMVAQPESVQQGRVLRRRAGLAFLLRSSTNTFGASRDVQGRDDLFLRAPLHQRPGHKGF